MGEMRSSFSTLHARLLPALTVSVCHQTNVVTAINYPDCLDESDESDCTLCGGKYTAVPQLQQVLINLDGKGYFTWREMNRNEFFPDTHYR